MPTVQHCLAMAAEAERLAAIVTYTRDKVRLAEQAQAWRDRAAALEAAPRAVAREARSGCRLSDLTARIHRRRA